jgi:CBS domain-containing protein
MLIWHNHCFMRSMKTEQVMTRNPRTCSPGDSLYHAAEVMWNGNVGALPVTDEDGNLVGIITDRDVCMTGYTQGGTLNDRPVSSAMARGVFCCGPADSIQIVAERMRTHQVRRLPVIENERLVGIVSLNDLALAAVSDGGGFGFEELSRTLAGICEHRVTQAAE